MLSVEQRLLLQTLSSQERIELLASRFHGNIRPPVEAPGQLPLFSNYDLGSVPVDTMRQSDADPLAPVRRELRRMEQWHRDHYGK